MLSESFLFTALSAHGEVGSTIEKPQVKGLRAQTKAIELAAPSASTILIVESNFSR
jgi:hypothetical protein